MSTHLHTRTDGREEVAPTDEADRLHGCKRHPDCILADGHADDCDEDREVAR